MDLTFDATNTRLVIASTAISTSASENRPGNLLWADFERGVLRYLEGHTTEGGGSEKMYETVVSAKLARRDEILLTAGHDATVAVLARSIHFLSGP